MSQGQDNISDMHIRKKYLSSLQIIYRKESLVFSPKPDDFQFQSDDLARKRFINKLISCGIAEKKSAGNKKHQSIIILDWDDTILATSYLNSIGFSNLSIQISNQIKQLDQQASVLLNKCTQYGKVYIVTNAAHGWIEYSSRIYLPLVNQILSRKQIQVISARSKFQNEHPGDYYKWKQEAFKKLGQMHQQQLVTNLICIGDSNIQIDATHVLAKRFREPLIKTIKFKQHPKPEQLVKQQQLVVARLEDIYMSMKAMTIRLQRKSA